MQHFRSCHTIAEDMATHMADHPFLKTTFPVLLPAMPELQLDKPDFDAHIKTLLGSPTSIPIRAKNDNNVEANARDPGQDEDQKAGAAESNDTKGAEAGITTIESEAPFMKGLLVDKSTVPSFDERDGKMLTENADVAHSTSGQALVDAFFELEYVISASRLKNVLEKAWKDDGEATLKIIWNTRSIHLGKSSRFTFYRAVGWLAQNHPLTLIANLPWLVRPLIQKNAPKKDDQKQQEAIKQEGAEIVDGNDAESDFELVEDEELEGQPEKKKLKFDSDEAELAEFDIKFGVAHGYWKDLINILALAANGQLKVNGDPKSVLNVEKPTTKKYKRDWTEGRKKVQTSERHERAIEKLEKDAFYKALHLTVAKLFASQLLTDLARLNSGDKSDLKRITLAAKWAPTHNGMHDQHTCIASSIAELLHPFDTVCPDTVDPTDRELYLKHARLAYQRQTLSPLRKHLQIVERPITAEKFEEIRYERVPSLAMKQYTPLFARKDFARFDDYIEKVASGKSRISGATLLPSALVNAVDPDRYGYRHMFGATTTNAKGADDMVEQKLKEMQFKALGGQWNSLVQRIKDSGTIESSIAVCDVSGSMTSPRFPDGTCPMDSAIGLSLLLAEVTKPPFGGAFITFSQDPQVMRVGGADDKRSFQEKVEYIQESNWSMNTDFVAIFERLILPMAVENKLSQEDMVKQVFVFSDMQFDNAAGHNDRWTTSYERIQKQFKDAGYDMPRLVFWNLAGGRAGYGSTTFDNSASRETAPKPVTAAEEGIALVSGYSQGQMKMFLDNGSFEDPEAEAEEVVDEREGEDGEIVVEKKAKKGKQDPLAVVRKAISHAAYRMLKVVD